MKRAICFIAVMVILSGCISYEYDGVTEKEETTNVKTYTNIEKIAKPFTVMGKARVSGYYSDVTKERLEKKLVSEAQKAGANAVLITGVKVVPYEQLNSKSNYNTEFSYDNQPSSWRTLSRDFDQTYGSVRGTNPVNTTTTSYRRIIYADFLKFNNDK